MDSLPKDINNIVEEYALRDKIVEQVKRTIFKILVTFIDWRRYGVEPNRYLEECSSLDEYIQTIGDEIYSRIKSDKMCVSWERECDYHNCFYLSDYIPCVSTMHGDECDKITEDFLNGIGLDETVVCAECRSENNVEEM